MYVESFILTTDSPPIFGGEISLGTVVDGIFAVPGFPASIEFGALLELIVDDDDLAGAYEVEILLEYAREADAPQATLRGGFTFEVLEPDPDWWGPRREAQPLHFVLDFWDEFEGFLVVRVNGDEIGERALRVIHNQVPDGL